MEEKGAEKRSEVQATEVQVMNYQMNFCKKAFFDAATRFSAAYEHLDVGALEIATYKAEAASECVTSDFFISQHLFRVRRFRSLPQRMVPCGPLTCLLANCR